MPRDKYEGSVGARAQVTIELSGLGSWGTPYTMEQIIDQATSAAEGRIRNAFQKEGNVKIIGDINITAVYASATKAH